MRWFPIRKAKIDAELRKTFEQYGTLGMQVVLALGGNVKHGEQRTSIDTVLESAQSWLTEQYDWETSKERASLVMEFAITVFVAMEVIPFHRIVSWICGKL